MVFKIGRKHSDISTPNTFFGYYKDDGFKKKKNIGRIEQIDPITQTSKWINIEKEWIDLYRNRREKPGRSATSAVSASDEWVCEAYMDTDYTALNESDFINTLNGYACVIRLSICRLPRTFRRKRKSFSSERRTSFSPLSR